MCCGFSKILQNITVEPFVLYMIANVLTAMAAQNLYLDKACRVNLKFSDEICESLAKRNIGNFTTEEVAVQRAVAKLIEWKSIVQTFIPCLLILFVGSWSDRNRRRKPCMLFPILGELISSVGLALNVYFSNWPMEYAAFCESFFESITGGWVTMSMGVYSYMSDITTEEDRTLRLGIVNTCLKSGLPFGLVICGFLLKYTGFYGVFGVSAIIHGIAFFYGLIFIEEHSEKSRKFSFADFFDPTNAMQTLKIFTKKTLKVQLILLTIVAVLIFGPVHGQKVVLYLYTRYRFNWSLPQYGIFMTYSHVTTTVGALITLSILSQRLKLHDSFVGIIGSLSKAASNFLYAFATTSSLFYFGPIIEFFHYASFICMRSLATKMVKKDEVAKVNSLLGVIETATGIIYAPIYTRIYRATITTLPGAFFFFGAGLKIFSIVPFIILYKIQQAKTITNEVDLEKKEQMSEKNPN